MVQHIEMPFALHDDQYSDVRCALSLQQLSFLFSVQFSFSKK